MIAVTVQGAAKTVTNLRRAEARSAALSESLVRRGSILARRLLVQRMDWRGGRDPFWGTNRTSPLAYLAGQTGESRKRLSPGGIVLRSGNESRSAVGSPDPHIAFLEHGGTIRGRRYLRIATAAMRTPGTQDRLTGASARSLVSAFVFRSKRGNLWIAIRDRSKRLTLLYLLRESVTIRRRPIFALVTDEVNLRLSATARQDVTALVAEANR